MGGGHLSRPDFGMPQPDPDHPLTEFYLLLQHGLDKAGARNTGFFVLFTLNAIFFARFSSVSFLRAR